MVRACNVHNARRHRQDSLRLRGENVLEIVLPIWLLSYSEPPRGLIQICCGSPHEAREPQTSFFSQTKDVDDSDNLFDGVAVRLLGLV
jgi:hypothetical protein